MCAVWRTGTARAYRGLFVVNRFGGLGLDDLVGLANDVFGNAGPLTNGRR